MANENYLLRGVRNTLLDMLLNPVAVTYPLFDLPVQAVNEMVLYDSTAALVISNSQPDVTYQLFEDIDEPGKAYHTDTPGELTIPTGKLTKQVHAFRVKATKMYPPFRSNNLYQVVNIRVGVNVGLEVIPQKTVLNYSEKVVLTVKNAQKGAWYSVVYFAGEINALPPKQLLTVDNEADLETILMPAGPAAFCISKKFLGDNADLQLETTYGLREDMELRVFVDDANTGLTGLLNAAVIIGVMPDISLPAVWYSQQSKSRYNKTGAADYGSAAGVRLKLSQSSVKYRLRLDAMDGPDTKTDIYLSDWVNGVAGVLDIPLIELTTEDMLLTVIAEKVIRPLGAALTQRVVIPVYPAHDKTFTVVDSQDPQAGKTIKVGNAQSGILYQLRNTATNELIVPPVFYHRNYGIGNTRICGDSKAASFDENAVMSDDWWIKSLFVVGNSSTDDEVLLPVGPLTADTSFEVIATKSTTGFSKIIGTISVNF
ncbi:hypothetical protein [Mucilaginibacter phyllosphaerae]|uniref:Uncharacterized protein n=1 Tax=Mucilaginibacter phyllosphaerae TaxID=1812349 RepID=A0A4Y8ABT4_9SPHI|nr:hypothetical protein [Mucilaginibacter phyllosphaerae]MBB3969159.1 hypothetical protein [Mucilaginibacter phyllosphaerae]TEW66031.1 hypothetical protein E2R65_12975 [Mucilaginibacter phyllosphaerae]GGH06668.1 hypothetical protein GCM10007352_11020 [Mucilaginibacter phyllosphaerae]